MNNYFMNLAYKEAIKAKNLGEVPVGAVIVKDNKIIGKGYNIKEKNNDPTAHAEIIAIREASKNTGGWRLTGCSMYVTLEPCLMCLGAIVQARISNIYIGARDIKQSSNGELKKILYENDIGVEWDVMEEKCSDILKVFFKDLRINRNERQNS